MDPSVPALARNPYVIDGPQPGYVVGTGLPLALLAEDELFAAQPFDKGCNPWPGAESVGCSKVAPIMDEFDGGSPFAGEQPGALHRDVYSQYVSSRNTTCLSASGQVRPATRSLLKRATTVSGSSLTDFMRDIDTPAP